jgi:hypothetical protein
MLTDGSLTVGFGRHLYPRGGSTAATTARRTSSRSFGATATRERFGKVARATRCERAISSDSSPGRAGAPAIPASANASCVRADLEDGLVTEREAREVYGLGRLLSTIRAMQLDASTLPALARGCAILAPAAGATRRSAPRVRSRPVEDHGPVPLVDLDELPDEALDHALRRRGRADRRRSRRSRAATRAGACARWSRPCGTGRSSR